MRPADLITIGIDNLRRSILRTALTTLGVTIGIGALVSMVSFGTGMQKNISDTFAENDLLLGLHVTPQKIEVDQILSGDLSSIVDSAREKPVDLNDAAVDSMRNLEGVEVAYSELAFPVRIRMNGRETRTSLRAIPSFMQEYRPYNQMPFGRFFTSDDEHSVVITPQVLQDLGLLIGDGLEKSRLSPNDSLNEMKIVFADSLLGKTVEILTSTLDIRTIASDPIKHIINPSDLPLLDRTIHLTIVGIGRRQGAFEEGQLQRGIMVPMATAKRIPHLGFSSVWDLMGRNRNQGYESVYVRLRSLRDLDSVKAAIETMGFGVFSLADQFQEIKRAFLIMDAMLGTVGVIALVVAALGIINTMVMSILERTREIGVMKAIGGSEPVIRSIFFVEAGCIGFFGGVFGLLLGWLVTRLANWVANLYLRPIGFEPVSLFYLSWWLILGAMAFSILISLAAGLYPASRAARVNPIEALRHD